MEVYLIWCTENRFQHQGQRYGACCPSLMHRSARYTLDSTPSHHPISIRASLPTLTGRGQTSRETFAIRSFSNIPGSFCFLEELHYCDKNAFFVKAQGTHLCFQSDWLFIISKARRASWGRCYGNRTRSVSPSEISLLWPQKCINNSSTAQQSVSLLPAVGVRRESECEHASSMLKVKET